MAQDGNVDELRFQVFGLSGREVFDSGLQTGQMLDWRMTNDRGQKLANGVYLYQVQVRDVHGNVQDQRIGKLVIRPDRADLSREHALPHFPDLSEKLHRNDQTEHDMKAQGDDDKGTACGHDGNKCTGSSDDDTVGGGNNNIASFARATVSGGSWNEAGGDASTVGGGSENTASGQLSTVSGGACNRAGTEAQGNCIGGSDPGDQATVGGGINNLASGMFGTVPGGEKNKATGSHSLAAGGGASANHDGSFVWSDGTTTSADAFVSQQANTFLIEATNGVGINTNDPSQALDVSGDARIRNLTSCDTIDTDGNGNLSCVSAGTGLSKFGSTLSIASGGVGATEIDSSAVQERVTGSCTGDFEAIRSIRADGSVECVTIVPLLPGTTDFSGTALGSDGASNEIAELRGELARKSERIQALEAENTELKQQLEDLLERVEQLEQQVESEEAE